jgi:hypothetical protein
LILWLKKKKSHLRHWDIWDRSSFGVSWFKKKIFWGFVGLDDRFTAMRSCWSSTQNSMGGTEAKITTLSSLSAGTLTSFCTYIFLEWWCSAVFHCNF